MSRVEVLIDSRSNLSVKFMEFTRIVSKDKCSIFFEGEDEKYYSIRIGNIRPDLKWSGINSGGKTNVIKLRHKVREHPTYSKARCLFFVDADFDDNSELFKLNDLYVTPCYSVENLYISQDAFIRILSAEFGVNDSTDNQRCFENAIAVFNSTRLAYIDAIKGFNILIRELRLMEYRKELGGRLNINNVKFESLVKVDIERVEKIYDENTPNSIFPELNSKIVVNLDNSRTHFESLDGEYWFRGKQNIEFFRIFIEKLKTDRCKKNSRKVFNEKGNVKLQISKGNCISELSQYADTPECLSEFLKRQQAVSHVA